MSDYDILDVRFTFKKRPLDLPGDLRPNWRVPLLLMMLHYCCRGGKSSLYKLHLLNWMMRDQQRQDALLSSLTDVPRYEGIRVQVEPSFIQAILFAAGEGLLEHLDNSRVRITDAGVAFAKEAERTECLIHEKHFLKLVGLKLTEDWVTRFLAWSRNA
jgi:hypothetical protein